MLDAYIYEGLRTPFGRYAGSLAKVRPDDLMASAIRSVMAVTKFKAEQIEDIVLGCANQAGEDARCVARHAGLSAELPIEIPGTVLQRNCASGLGSARSVWSPPFLWPTHLFSPPSPSVKVIPTKLPIKFPMPFWTQFWLKTLAEE